MSPGSLARLVEKSKFVSVRKPVVALAFLLAVSFATVTLGQHSPQDPGVRGGTVNSGQPLSSVSQTPGAPDFFANGLLRFQEIESVQGGANNGLGPRFNSNQCSSCHSQPAVGGTSPSATVFPSIGPNPETLVYGLDGAQNTLPSFITPNGPVREARFKFFLNPNGSLSSTPDGGVHDLFVISGRSDAGSCAIKQPNFHENLELNNVIFRIPTPTFGAGLIENISEETIYANMQANAEQKQDLGISGVPNRDGNDGMITRFGWKAQNKSLEIFAGEAYNVEMGVTNELFQNERASPDEAQAGGLPAGRLRGMVPTRYRAARSRGSRCRRRPRSGHRRSGWPLVCRSGQRFVRTRHTACRSSPDVGDPREARADVGKLSWARSICAGCWPARARQFAC